MAASTTIVEDTWGRKFTSATDETVGTSLVAVTEEIECRDFSEVAFEVENSGANAFTNFQMRVKANVDSAFTTILDSATTPTWRGSLATLASAAFATEAVDIKPYYSLQLWAVAGTATTANINGQLKNFG